MRSGISLVSMYKIACMQSLMNIGAILSSIISSSCELFRNRELCRIFSPLRKCIIALEKWPRNESKQTKRIHDIKAVRVFCFPDASDRLRCEMAFVYWLVANPNSDLAASHLVARSSLRFEKSSWSAPSPIIACRRDGSATLACNMRCSQKEGSKYPLSSVAVFEIKYWNPRRSSTVPASSVGIRWISDVLCTSGLNLVRSVAYPSQHRPVETHLWQEGLASSHLTRRILVYVNSNFFLNKKVQWHTCKFDNPSLLWAHISYVVVLFGSGGQLSSSLRASNGFPRYPMEAWMVIWISK